MSANAPVIVKECNFITVLRMVGKGTLWLLGGIAVFALMLLAIELNANRPYRRYW